MGRSATQFVLGDSVESKQVVGHAQKSETRTKAIVDASPDLVFVVDGAGKFLDYYAGDTDQLYISREQIIGNKLEDVMPDDIAAEASRSIKTALDSGEAQTFGYQLCLSGEPKDFEARITVSGAGEVLILVRDVTGRKRAEQTLLESEQRFRNVFEQSVDALLVHDDKGRMVDCNAEAYRSLGYTREELLTLSVGDFATNLVNAEGRARGGTLWECLMADESGTVTGVHKGEHRRKDGSTFPVEVRLGSVDYDGRRLIFGSARDITEQKSIEDALRDSEERYRLLVESSPEPIAVHSEGVIVYINPSGAELFGATNEEELIGRQALDFVHPDYKEKVLRRISGILQNNERAPLIEERYIRLDGSIVDVEVTGTPIAYRGKLAVQVVFKDITERKQAEEKLRESEERFRAIFEQNAMGISIADPDRNLLETNAAYQRITGYSGEELAGKEIANLSYPDDVPVDESRNKEIHAGDTDRYHREKRYIRKDGEVIWVRPTISAVRDAGGEPQFLIGMVEDITERKKAEAALRRQKEYLDALNEMTLGLVERLEPEDLLESILTRAGALLGTTHGYVSLLTPEEDQLRLRTGIGFFTDLVDEQIGTHVGLSGKVFQSGEPLAVDDYSSWPGHRTDVDDPPYSIVGVPLRSGLRVVGVICLVYMEKERSFGSDEVEVLGRFAELASVALDNARLYTAAQQELAERKALEKELAHRAFHDPLTNLPNRSLFENRLEQAIARTNRSGGQVAVLFLDLDNFKVINDSLGHEAGDELLIRVGKRLRKSLRPSDTAARIGGDEFVVLLDVKDGAAEASRVAGRILDALRIPFLLQKRELVVNASVGIVIGGAKDHSGDLMRNADLAMYRAKARGKAHYEVFVPDIHYKALERLKLEEDLRRAIEQDELRTNYQPQVRLDTGQMAGMEALVRWEHPQRGLILPEEFIPVAEESNLIIPIGKWILREACRQASQWQTQHPGDPYLTISVNLSAHQILRPELVGEVAEILEETGLAARDLNLEITESVIMGEAQTNVEILEGLKELGVQLAIDDFGTGYSSLSYLNRFPVDCLKIDRSFVEDLLGSSGNTTVVSSIVALAHALGMQVIAEGVETEEQLTKLRDLGCDQAQGYLFSKPLVREEASGLVANRRNIRTYTAG